MVLAERSQGRRGKPGADCAKGGIRGGALFPHGAIAVVLMIASHQSGLRNISFLPLYTGTRAPRMDTDSTIETIHSDGSHERPNTEPICVTTTYFRPRIRKKQVRGGGEY